ncbi:MAG TPA: RagB/SusD family nutrient uptake outer membrane protein [Petrimonas sp.]|uniref:RagB/SusD family nutrient uptake outer membrane protein n=1 Tax=Petrimonas sp. TaxID=2023866 RepID=UPI00174F9467|nr:RagB/SusD family nutrient uptake outer membrane protein [Petrimonas sp.]
MKLSKLNILLLLTLFVSGCTDLVENPVGRLIPDGFIKSEKDVQTVIYGAYGKMASDNYWGREMAAAIMLRSDMVDIGNRSTVAARIQINDFNTNSTNAMIGTFWPMAYQTIDAVNTAIAGAENLEPTVGIKALIGEAKFIRAFTYFNLVRLFGDIPYLDEPVKDPEAVATISKTTESTVYQKIIDDLAYAKENLPMRHPLDDVRSRPSRGSAYTMLADVYLTIGNWQEAYNNAKWVIDNAASLNYALESDYQDLFDSGKQDGMPEHIFAIEYKRGSAWPFDYDSHAAFTGMSGSDEVAGFDVAVPSLAVYTTWDSRDYRKKVALADSAHYNGLLVPYTKFQGTQRPHIAKYWRHMGVPRDLVTDTENNYAIYRYAEVLLTAAEALNEVSGPTAEARGYVNQVRARARNWAGTATDFPADVNSGISKDDFRTLVLEERRLELSFEFKRWWDIKRRKMGNDVFKGPNSLEPHPDFNDNQYLLPIMQRDIDLNPNLTQNPGY